MFTDILKQAIESEYYIFFTDLCEVKSAGLLWYPPSNMAVKAGKFMYKKKKKKLWATEMFLPMNAKEGNS